MALRYSGGGKPCAGVKGYAFGRPALDGDRANASAVASSAMSRSPETPRHGRDHPRPLLSVDLGDHLAKRWHGYSAKTWNGRSSILRLQAFDPSAASFSAASRSGASMIQKPARNSFDSRNGPSVKDRLFAARVDDGRRARLRQAVGVKPSGLGHAACR